MSDIIKAADKILDESGPLRDGDFISVETETDLEGNAVAISSRLVRRKLGPMPQPGTPEFEESVRQAESDPLLSVIAMGGWRLALRQMIRESHQTARSKGWWDNPRTLFEQLFLFHTEISEAGEELRNNHEPDEIYFRADGKPEGFLTELADELIRIFDTIGYLELEDEFFEALRLKMEFNRTRSRRHGGKAL